MDEKLFIARLKELIDQAAQTDYRITRQSIRDQFEATLTDQQLQMVIEYLKNSHIQVEGEDEIRRDRKKKTADPADNAYYRMYMEEISMIEPCADEETAMLLKQWKAGDESAKRRLVEGHLHRIVLWSGDYIGLGMAVNDLVQEGNIALLEAVEAYREGDFEAQLRERFNTVVKEALDRQAESRQVGERIASRANRLLEVSSEIAEESGREATVEELAERLHLTQEEVMDIMKISLDVISIEEGHHH